jgi:hypothetical protein
MERKPVGRATLVATLIALSVTTPVAAMAEPTPAPTSDAVRNPMEQFRIDRDNFNAAMKARNLAIRNINNDFKAACEKAASDFRGAMSIARTPDQKNFAAQARKNAISNAIIARDAAIAALGAEPVPPIEPAKPLKAPKNKSR